MVASWIEEAKQEEEEFFEDATSEEIEEALHLANYHEYKDGSYASLNSFPEAQSLCTHASTEAAPEKMNEWRPFEGGQRSHLGRNGDAADDYSYAMAA